MAETLYLPQLPSLNTPQPNGGQPTSTATVTDAPAPQPPPDVYAPNSQNIYPRETGRGRNWVRYDDGGMVYTDSQDYGRAMSYVPPPEFAQTWANLPEHYKASLGRWLRLLPQGETFVTSYLRGKTMGNVMGNTAWGQMYATQYADKVGEMAEQALGNLQAQRDARVQQEQQRIYNNPVPQLGGGGLYIPSPY